MATRSDEEELSEVPVNSADALKLYVQACKARHREISSALASAPSHIEIVAHPGLSPTSTAGEPKAIPSEIEFKKFSEALARCEKWDKAVRLSYSILTAADEVKNLTKVLYQQRKGWGATVETMPRFVNGILTLSSFGAGWTYAVIFSATRGNLDLICWAFSLFIMAAITAYPASSLSQMPRLLTKATSFLLVQLSVNLSLAAVVVLLVSVLSLDQYATQPTIAHPHVPGIIMLSCLGVTYGLVVLLVLYNEAASYRQRRSLINWMT